MLAIFMPSICLVFSMYSSREILQFSFQTRLRLYHLNNWLWVKYYLSWTAAQKEPWTDIRSMTSFQSIYFSHIRQRNLRRRWRPSTEIAPASCDQNPAETCAIQFTRRVLYGSLVHRTATDWRVCQIFVTAQQNYPSSSECQLEGHQSVWRYFVFSNWINRNFALALQQS